MPEKPIVFAKACLTLVIGPFAEWVNRAMRISMKRKTDLEIPIRECSKGKDSALDEVSDDALCRNAFKF